MFVVRSRRTPTEAGEGEASPKSIRQVWCLDRSDQPAELTELAAFACAPAFPCAESRGTCRARIAQVTRVCVPRANETRACLPMRIRFRAISRLGRTPNIDASSSIERCRSVAPSCPVIAALGRRHGDSSVSVHRASRPARCCVRKGSACCCAREQQASADASSNVE